MRGADIVREVVGADVTGVLPGDHVVLSAADCATCAECQSGVPYRENLFAQDFGGRRSDGSTALSDADGMPISSHFFGQSSFDSYANVVRTSLTPVPASVPLEIRRWLGCGVNTGAGICSSTSCSRLRAPRSPSPARPPSGWPR